MIEKVIIRNFKKLGEIEVSLGNPVVLIGPNNSGKSSVFQALSLWEKGRDEWQSKKRFSKNLKERISVSINRKDLINTPIGNTRELWSKLAIRRGNENIKIEIEVQGITAKGEKWNCPLEFAYSNREVLYCKPVLADGEELKIEESAFDYKVAYLQPMSGISREEDKLVSGSIDRFLGEGRTSEVLRNICYQLYSPDNPTDNHIEHGWSRVVEHMQKLFNASLHPPVFERTTGLITVEYEEQGIMYDISAAGRGFQQALLILAYFYAHPGTVFLLDEPDAHLELIRQREIFQLLSEVAIEVNSQLVIATHSEVVINQSAPYEKIVALIENNAVELINQELSKNAKKALTEYGWENYYLAKLKKHILYLEGVTDHRILLAFAEKLNHPSGQLLREANVYYLATNIVGKAVNHFNAVSQMIGDINGLLLLDRFDLDLNNVYPIQVITWQRREIENYFTFPDTLLNYFSSFATEGPLFEAKHREIADKIIADNTPPRALRDNEDVFWKDTKVSDEYLPKIYSEFEKSTGLRIQKNKGHYYELVSYLPMELISEEVVEKLDVIGDLLGAGT